MAKPVVTFPDEPKLHTEQETAVIPVCDVEAEDVDNAGEDFEQQLSWALGHEKLQDYIKHIRMEQGLDKDEWEFGSELLSDPEEDVASFQEWLAGKGLPTFHKEDSTKSDQCKEVLDLTKSDQGKKGSTKSDQEKEDLNKLDFDNFNIKEFVVKIDVLKEDIDYQHVSSYGAKLWFKICKGCKQDIPEIPREPSKGIAGAFNKEDKA